MNTGKNTKASFTSKIIYDPPLTVEIDGVKELESILDLENCSSELCSVLDLPERSPNIYNTFESFEEVSIFGDLDKLPNNFDKEDRTSHYTATTMNSFDDAGMVTSDFENSSTSPISQPGRRLSNSSPPQPSDLGFIFMDQDGIVPLAVWSADALETSAQESEKIMRYKTQKVEHPRKIDRKSKFKVVKPTNNTSSFLQNVAKSCNMDLSYLFHCEDPQSAGSVIPSGTTLRPDNLSLYSNYSEKNHRSFHEPVSKKRSLEDSYNRTNTNSIKVTAGRPRKEKRIKCLKRDSSVTLEKKVEFFQAIIEDAKIKKVQGIILRDQAAAELRLGKDEHHALNLTLPNFDLVCQYLDGKAQEQHNSFRTIWKISRTQIDHHVSLEFHLSDETATVPDADMEISVFTLMAPGHSTKHLVTSCQYLEMVNFILGKDYNYLINDNLAETTVGSDGKMISTQKHHASRVRSHVKKLLKRHVVKDFKRYTAEDRSDPIEFEYKMALHNLVLQCYVKKPFESKVSIALMELGCVKKALTKQTEFFTFKKI